MADSTAATEAAGVSATDPIIFADFVRQVQSDSGNGSVAPQVFGFGTSQIDYDVTVLDITDVATAYVNAGTQAMSGPVLVIGCIFYGAALLNGVADIGMGLKARLYAFTDDPTNYLNVNPETTAAARRIFPDYPANNGIIIRNGNVFVPMRAIIAEPRLFLCVNSMGTVGNVGGFQASIITRKLPEKYTVNQ